MKFILCLLPLFAFAKDAPVKTLWHEWYLYSMNGDAVGYFEETAEDRPADKQISITQRWVEKEDGKTETYIGSVAQKDGKFTPIAFFSERKGQYIKYKIDGRSKGGKITVTFKSEQPKAADKKKVLTAKSNTLLSNFLPMALAENSAKKKNWDFSALVEDAKDGSFELKAGQASLEAVNKVIKGQNCRKFLVEFQGIQGEWWISKEGKLCELKIAQNHSLLQLSSEEEAKKALGL